MILGIELCAFFCFYYFFRSYGRHFNWLLQKGQPNTLFNKYFWKRCACLKFNKCSLKKDNPSIQYTLFELLLNVNYLFVSKIKYKQAVVLQYKDMIIFLPICLNKEFYTQVVDNVRFMNLFLVHNITLFNRCSLDDDAPKNVWMFFLSGI